MPANERVYWITFTDTTGTEDNCLGCCLVTVTEDDMLKCKWHLASLTSDEGDYWASAAVARAKEMGCNPGGYAFVYRIDCHPNFERFQSLYPYHQLMSLEEANAISPLVNAETREFYKSAWDE